MARSIKYNLVATYHSLMQGPTSCYPFNAAMTYVLRSSIHSQGLMSCFIFIALDNRGALDSYSDTSMSGPAIVSILSPSD